METLTIELLNPKAKSLLKNMQDEHLIKVLTKTIEKKKKLSSLLRGSISKETSDDFNKEIEHSRNQWERDI
jgi:hypothetical protein